MKNLLSLLKFKREANLLGARVYILKSMAAIVTMYLVATNNAVLKKDMISVLFALMLTIEPSTLKGFKQGLEQIYGSIIGGITGGIIVYLFGINAFSVSLSVVMTLYICIKINWKIVSPVALFTAIYMTQYVQKTESGAISMLLTFKLRMSAVLAGILIALFYNFIFALFSYKELLNKRVVFLLESLSRSMEKVKEGLESREEIEGAIKSLPEIFNNIDLTYNLFEDIRKENKFYKILNINIEKIYIFQKILLQLRNITHLEYDTCYILLNNLEYDRLDEESKELIQNRIMETLKKINYVVSHFYSLDNGDVKTDVLREGRYSEEIDKNVLRVLYNINEIEKCIIYMQKEIDNIRL